MKNKSIKKQFYFLASALIFMCAVSVSAQTTVFTYQGKLTDTGTPQNVYEMQFSLYGSAGGADQIGATITNPNVAVNQGVFIVQLDFGAAAFPGADRFLQISVRRSSSESFVTLNPRQQITSSPYSIRTLSAAQADVALDANKLGGVDASEYVTTSSVGNSFIKNSTTQQTANFNISGNGVVGGTLGVGMNPGGFKFSVNGPAQFRPRGNDDSSISFLSNVTGNVPTISLSKSDGSQAEMRLEGTSLRLVTGFGFGTPNNGITIDTTGNVGVGTTAPTSKLEIAAQNGLAITGFQPFMTFRDTNNFSKRSVLQSADGGFMFYPNDFIGGNPTMDIRNTGNVGIGTTGSATRLAIRGGPAWTSAGWTGSLSMGNASALGWEANASGQRFGIGQSTGGLYFFRTNSAFGNTVSPANYDLQITDTGNVTQARDKGGLVKAMIHVDPFLPASQYIVRCYNSLTNQSNNGCGFTVTRISQGSYRVDFGFAVSDRFISLTIANSNRIGAVDIASTNANAAFVFVTDTSGPSAFNDSRFYLFIY